MEGLLLLKTPERKVAHHHDSVHENNTNRKIILEKLLSPVDVQAGDRDE
ncbi:MAG: hypothetical protein GXY53_05420 [Desulfobulbus sp.]|nr:hypothetical protein [Desulfobulbus sp.]